MKSRSLAFIILGLVGVAGIAAIAVCGGFFYFAFKSTDEKLSPVVNEIFTAIDNGKFVDTYDTLTAPEFRKMMTREQYDTVGKTIAERLGRLQSKSLTNFKMHTTGSESYLQGTFEAVFDKGIAEIKLTTREIDGQRKIAGFFVNSPALAAPRPKKTDKPKPGDESQPAGEPKTDETKTDAPKSDDKDNPESEGKSNDEPKADAKEPAPAEQPSK